MTPRRVRESQAQLMRMAPKQVKTGNLAEQINPSDKSVLCKFHQADDALIQEAIAGALKAKVTWETLPWADRWARLLGLQSGDKLADDPERLSLERASS